MGFTTRKVLPIGYSFEKICIDLNNGELKQVMPFAFYCNQIFYNNYDRNFGALSIYQQSHPDLLTIMGVGSHFLQSNNIKQPFSQPPTDLILRQVEKYKIKDLQ
jgi:hypothetical protein